MFCSNRQLELKSCRVANSRGAVLVEFAVSLFLVWVLCSGVYGFGYAFYVYNRLLTAVMNAAELGAKLDYDTSDTDAYTTALKNMVLYGDTTAGTAPIVTGLSASNIVVTIGTDFSSMPRDVTVSIQNYSIDVIFRRISLADKPRAVARYFGKVICSGC